MGRRAYSSALVERCEPVKSPPDVIRHALPLTWQACREDNDFCKLGHLLQKLFDARSWEHHHIINLVGAQVIADYEVFCLCLYQVLWNLASDMG